MNISVQDILRESRENRKKTISIKKSDNLQMDVDEDNRVVKRRRNERRNRVRNTNGNTRNGFNKRGDRNSHNFVNRTRTGLRITRVIRFF